MFSTKPTATSTTASGHSAPATVLPSPAPRAFLWLTVAAVLAAGLYAYVLLPVGPWGYSDSATYVDTARHVLAGQGWHVLQPNGSAPLLTHHPPGYPTVLAVGMLCTGGDWLAAGRWVDVAALGLLVWLAEWWFYQATRSLEIALLAATVLAVSLPVVRAFTSLMSEPPFLVLLMGALYALWRGAVTRRERWWWLGVVLAAVDVLVRYAGLHAGIVIVIAALTMMPGTRRQRVERALLSAAVFLLPFALWLGYSRMAGRPPGGFAPPAHWPQATLAFLAQTARTFLAAVFPSVAHLPAVALGGFWLAVLLVALGWGAVWQRHGETASPWLQLAWLTVLDGLAWFPFLAFMFIAITPPPVLDFRMYTPAFVVALLSGVAVLFGGLRAYTPLPDRALGLWALALAVGLTVWLALPFSASHQALRRMHRDGEGFTSLAWQESMQDGVLHDLATLPPDKPLFSNNWAGVLLWLHRPATPLAELPHAVAWYDAVRWQPALLRWYLSQGVVGLLWVPGRDRSRLWWKAMLKRGGAFPCRSDAIGAIYCAPAALETLP